MRLSIFDVLNINTAILMLFLLYNQSLKPFFVKISKIFKLLLIIFEISLGENFNIN